WVLPVMLIAAACVLFLVSTPQSAPILDRARTLGGLSRLSQDSTWKIRESTWQGAVRMVQSRPWTGFGLGLYPYYQQSYTHTGVPIEAIGGRPSLGEQAHSLYLQTAAELGIPGLVLMIGVLVAFWWSGIRKVVSIEAGLRRTLLMGALGSSVALAVDGLASPSWQLAQT